MVHIDLLRTGVAAQAAALATQNVNLRDQKVTTKRIIKTGVTNLVGIPLLQSQSQLIGTL